MSDCTSSSRDQKPGIALEARRPWVQPKLTKMAAEDAELGTRAVVADGSFSVS